MNRGTPPCSAVALPGGGVGSSVRSKNPDSKIRDSAREVEMVASPSPPGVVAGPLLLASPPNVLPLRPSAVSSRRRSRRPRRHELLLRGHEVFFLEGRGRGGKGENG
jgi:hypothetical protein